MKEIRCKKCNRLLMKGEIKKISIKCPKCGYVNWLDEEQKESWIKGLKNKEMGIYEGITIHERN